MMTLGDIISQQAIERKGWENHDIPRSFRTFVYGVCIGGPVMGSWFGFINRTITIKNRWAGKHLYTFKKKKRRVTLTTEQLPVPV